jgi:hypothetical protein
LKQARVLAGILVLLGFSSFVNAQDGFFSSWEDRVRTTLAEQPGWAVPVVTPSSALVQLFRSDVVRQITPTATTTWNYGNSKGLDLVPWYKTELDIALPPYVQHDSSKVKDGFGDFTMQLKYRIAAANEQHGSYSVSVSLTGSVPTGSYKNGSPDASIAPAVHAGKGFGKFDLQSSLSAILPTADTAALGRPLTWNVVAQYRVAKIFWPEIENNATYFHGGPHDGKTQDFITPGLMIHKIKFESDPSNRLAISFGTGLQIAASHYHQFNHAVIGTARVAF